MTTTSAPTASPISTRFCTEPVNFTNDQGDDQGICGASIVGNHGMCDRCRREYADRLASYYGELA